MLAKLLVKLITPGSEGKLFFIELKMKNIIKPGIAIPPLLHPHIHSSINTTTYTRQRLVESRLGKTHVSFVALVVKQISPFNQDVAHSRSSSDQVRSSPKLKLAHEVNSVQFSVCAWLITNINSLSWIFHTVKIIGIINTTELCRYFNARLFVMVVIQRLFPQSYFLWRILICR